MVRSVQGQYSGQAPLLILRFSGFISVSKTIGPYFEELAKTYTELSFIKVDVDQLEDVVSEANVGAMPTFIVYQEGKEVGKEVGANKEKLEQLVKKYASQPREV